MSPLRTREVVTCMKGWYAIQVMRGREERVADLVGRTVPRELAEECFYPRYVTETKVRGRWVSVERPMFPGYLIAVSGRPAELSHVCARLGEFARLLTMDGAPVPLAREEVELIGGLTRPGERVVPMSRAVKVGERVVITEGPLVGHEGLIRELNRRKSTAYLEVDLCGRKVGARVGVAVLSSAESAGAHAAALRVRAAEGCAEPAPDGCASSASAPAAPGTAPVAPGTVPVAPGAAPIAVTPLG